MKQRTSPAQGMVQEGPDSKSGFSPNTPKLNAALQHKNTKKTIKCVFDRYDFLITLTDGVKNKSIGITHAQMAQIFPKIREFLA